MTDPIAGNGPVQQIGRRAKVIFKQNAVCEVSERPSSGNGDLKAEFHPVKE